MFFVRIQTIYKFEFYIPENFAAFDFSNVPIVVG